MAEITRYRPEDRRAVDALYRRVFGNDAAEASRLRWDWQYARNPNNPGGGPEIWIAREGKAIVGQYATMPVQVSVRGELVRGSWGMDVMVAPERQRQGLGELLFRTWDRNVGASLGLGLSESSHRLFQKLRWPDVGPLPCLVKPLTRRALRRANWPQLLNQLVSALTLPFVKAARRGERKEDDLLEKVRVARLRRQIAQAGLQIQREELHATSTVRRLPATLGRWLRESPLTQDALISNIEYVLTRAPA